jgi:MFS transporter, ACS family, allantoate permease
MSVSSLSEKNGNATVKHNHATAEAREVDEAAQLAIDGIVDPAESLRVRCVVYHSQKEGLMADHRSI